MPYQCALRVICFFALFVPLCASALVTPKKIIRTVKFPVLIYSQNSPTLRGRVTPDSLALERVTEYEVKATFKAESGLAVGREALLEEEKISLLDTLSLMKPTSDSVLRYMNFETGEVKERVGDLCKYLCSDIHEDEKNQMEASLFPVMIDSLRRGDIDLNFLATEFKDVYEYVGRVYKIIQKNLSDDVFIKERFSNGIVRLLVGDFGEEIFKQGVSLTLRRYLQFISQHSDGNWFLVNPEYYHLTCFEASLDNRILSGLRLILLKNPECSKDVDTVHMKVGFEKKSDVRGMLKQFRCSGMIERAPVLISGTNGSFGRLACIDGSMTHLCQPLPVTGKGRKQVDAFTMLDIRSIIKKHELFGLKRTFNRNSAGALLLESSACEVAKYHPERIGKCFTADMKRSDLFPTLTGQLVPDGKKQLFSRQVSSVLSTLLLQADTPTHPLKDSSCPLVMGVHSGSATVMDFPWLSVDCASVDYWFFDILNVLGCEKSPGLVIRLNPAVETSKPLVLVIPLSLAKITWHLVLLEGSQAAAESHCKVCAFLKKNGSRCSKWKGLVRESGYYSSSGSILSVSAASQDGSGSLSSTLGVGSKLSASDTFLSQKDSKRKSGKSSLSPVCEHRSQVMSEELSFFKPGKLSRHRSLKALNYLERERQRRKDNAKEGHERFLSGSKIKKTWCGGSVSKLARAQMSDQIHLFLRITVNEYDDVCDKASVSIYLSSESRMKVIGLLKALEVDNAHDFCCNARESVKGYKRRSTIDQETEELTILDAFEYVYREIAQNRKKMAIYLASLITDMGMLNRIKEEVLYPDSDVEDSSSDEEDEVEVLNDFGNDAFLRESSV
ncbi:hypothetical protein ACWJJH_20450 [Endozoicomonadaceae bacterium StTr2]